MNAKSRERKSNENDSGFGNRAETIRHGLNRFPILLTSLELSLFANQMIRNIVCVILPKLVGREISNAYSFHVTSVEIKTVPCERYHVSGTLDQTLTCSLFNIALILFVCSPIIAGESYS